MNIYKNVNLIQPQQCKRSEEPPEEVFAGGEERLDGGAGGEEFCDREDMEAIGHDENGSSRYNY